MIRKSQSKVLENNNRSTVYCRWGVGFCLCYYHPLHLFKDLNLHIYSSFIPEISYKKSCFKIEKIWLTKQVSSCHLKLSVIENLVYEQSNFKTSIHLTLICVIKGSCTYLKYTTYVHVHKEISA